MKTLTFPQLLFASLGALLVWAAIKNDTPAGVIRAAFGATPATTPGEGTASKLPGMSLPGQTATGIPYSGQTVTNLPRNTIPGVP